MSAPIVKPWASVGDDVDNAGTGGALDSMETVEAGRVDPPRSLSIAFLSQLKRQIAKLRITCVWVYVPLAVAAAWLIWSVILSEDPQAALATREALGILALIILSGAIVSLARIARRNALHFLLRSIQREDSAPAGVTPDGPIESDLQTVWQAIELHAKQVEGRSEEIIEANKQLTLELSLADTHRRQAASILNALNDPVLAVDAFDQLVQANHASEVLFGFSLKESMRRPLRDVIGDERLLRLVQQAREADIRSAERRAELEIDKRNYAIGLTPLTVGREESSADSGHGVVVTLRDVTRERDVSKKKSEFVAHVAHELRTPLSSIKAYVEMLVDGEAKDEKTRKEFCDNIQTSADRLGRLIDNMLNISRIEAGTVRINKEPMAVSMIVKEAIDVMRPQAEEKGISLTEELTPVMYRVMADRDLMFQAILNLVSNAVKYTPTGGQVRVRMTPHEEKNTMFIEVSDTGVGIPGEDLPKMFEKFYRVEANNKMAKGTGLGLNLVKQVVETIHGGTVTLTSEVGKGSRFGIILPLMPEKA